MSLRIPFVAFCEQRHLSHRVKNPASLDFLYRDVFPDTSYFRRFLFCRSRYYFCKRQLRQAQLPRQKSLELTELVVLSLRAQSRSVLTSLTVVLFPIAIGSAELTYYRLSSAYVNEDLLLCCASDHNISGHFMRP
jgi:hypothetical protein